MYEQIDVHWRLNYWSRDPDLENRMRRRAIAMTIGGTKTKTLDHTDHLLHALAHGVAWEGGGTVTRWVADSVYLARSGIIDWDRLVDDAVRSGFGPQAREGLRFLVEQSFVEVPWSTIAALERTRPDPIAELAHWARNSPPTPASMLCRLFVTDYPARSAGQPMLQRIRGYPGYIVRTISDENDSRMSGLLTGLRRGPTDRSFRAPKTK